MPYRRHGISFQRAVTDPRWSIGLSGWLCIVVAGTCLFAPPARAVEQVCNAHNTVKLAPGESPTADDGICQTGEECDDGENNSQSVPDACRSGGRLPGCGDAVVDTGEQCDEGLDERLANRCRPDCTLPRCGDGLTDDAAPWNEQCDDGNTNDTDGCLANCRTCVSLAVEGNIEVTEDTRLCAGKITLDDYGDYGAVIVKRSGITLDCNGLELTGEGRGVGIMVFRSNDVTIRNCTVFGYETGIKGEDSDNLTLLNNRLCNSGPADIELPGATQTAGTANACRRSGGWNDTGKSGCSERIVSCDLPVAQVNQPAAVSAAAARAPARIPQASVQAGEPAPEASAPGTRTIHAPAAAAMKSPQGSASMLVGRSAEIEAKVPDLAITGVAFVEDCRLRVEVRNLGAPIGEESYRKGGVVLERYDDERHTRNVPLGRVDRDEALMTGQGTEWIDTGEIRGRAVVTYRLVNVASDASAGNNEARIRIPRECQARQ